MPRWIGLLGSWALLVLGAGVLCFALAGEWINLKDGRRLRRLETLDRMIEKRHEAKVASLKASMAARGNEMQQLQSKVTSAQQTIDEMADSDQTIVISTEENKLYLMRSGQKLFETPVSTGKGATSVDGGRTMIFDTPIGKFHIISKEEDPVWVPPDWHYAEEARKRGMRVVHLNPGRSIDADTGGPVQSGSSGVWGWFSNSGSNRVLKVQGNSVVEVDNGVAHELPPGQIITAGDAIVIPPIGTPQRKFDKVLGSFRLNLGDGYAIHGTQAANQLGRSVSHGCVRVGDADLARLYAMANVGDEVIIY